MQVDKYIVTGAQVLCRESDVRVREEAKGNRRPNL